MSFDVEQYLKVVRLGGLAVGPGDRLALGASRPGRDGKAFETELRSIDAATGAATRLVAPTAGNAPVAFTRTGDLLFKAKRDDTEAPEAEKVGEAGSLWLLPAAGGEARRLLSAAGGIGAVEVATAADTIVAKIDVFPSAGSLQDDRATGKARDDSGATGYLWDSYPVRYWDHPLAPRSPRLFATDVSGAEPRDLTGDVGNALVEQDFVVSADGATVVTAWATPIGNAVAQYDLVSIDVATGERATLLSVPDTALSPAAISPDGRHLAYSRETLGTPEIAVDIKLWLLDLRSGETRQLAPELDRWPEGVAFTADGTGVLLTSANLGASGIWRIPVEPAGAPAVLVSGDGAFTDVTPAWSSSRIFAMRSRIGSPPELVEVTADGVRVLHAEGFGEPYPGRVEEVCTTAADGTGIRAWLVVPNGASAVAPAPLALFIHGGPRGSWNSWQWRWQPMLLAARGYAVLLPDPALSTGYGQPMINRGHGQWGGAPYDDVIALTDTALERPDLDASRTAVLGGSYGGYLTNWTITHTDRFRCAVTHAALWDLTPFRGATDSAVAWEYEFGHPRENRDFYVKWSPATHADAIVTPTLVIHGEKDFRVPVGEGLAIYTELQRLGVPSQLLYFPDENHWILKPGNISLWYDTVLAWLDHWVLGKDLIRPAHV